MPLHMQAKLLRVLEEGEVERIGGDKPIAVDVRVLVATHRNLEELVEQGKFRQDLFHRVVVFPITLPPLRRAAEDIPALIEHFAAQVCAQNGWKPVPFAGRSDRGVTSSIPGRATFASCETWWSDCCCWRPEARSMLPPSNLPCPRTRGSVGITGLAAITAVPLSEQVASFEREAILTELERQHHHITNTAKALGLERSHLYKKCEQLGIDLRAVRDANRNS